MIKLKASRGIFMKRKAILCLILIGLSSFNLIGCMNNDKDINQKSEQQGSVSNENSKTDKKDINKTNTNSDTKISENDKTTNNKEKIVKENNSDTKTTQKSKKQIYKDKLDNIQLGLKDLAHLYAGNTIEMKSAASQEYERWDNALNEIYGVLKQQLSSDDMNKLKKEQIKWISDRDDKAKKESLEYKGGTAEQLIYTSSLAQTTKERCYELVEKYMK
jgi:uncharacterized protein YecT (DUF1311 family)